MQNLCHILMSKTATEQGTREFSKSSVSCSNVTLAKRLSVNSCREVAQFGFIFTVAKCTATDWAMDINYHSNRIVANRSTPNFYAGSTSRQYGSGVGAAIRLGLKSFVIPLAKRYGLPLAKNFLSSAAPEVLDLINGQKKPKAAFKSAVKKTIKKQVGGKRLRRSVVGVVKGRSVVTRTRKKSRKSALSRGRRKIVSKKRMARRRSRKMKKRKGQKKRRRKTQSKK